MVGFPISTAKGILPFSGLWNLTKTRMLGFFVDRYRAD